jgi:NADPH:quinone reductase-like Zn-dependent oxidoreductase
VRVVTQDRYGGPEVLYVSERPVPVPAPTEVRVRVQASGVNPVDLGTRSGGGVADVIGDPPFVLGWETSGVIDAVAPGVTRFAVGDEVFGLLHFPRQAGTYAEFVTGPARQFTTKPATLDHTSAGGLALAGLTAWQVLVDTAAVHAGQRLLVHGAGGGVGHLVAQLALGLGAEVIGTARTAKHRRLRELGVHDVVDYTTDRFPATVGPVDTVIDIIPGDDGLRTLEIVRPEGSLVYVPSDILPDHIADAAASRGVRATSFLVEPDHTGLAELAALVTAGQLRVLVHECLPLHQAPQAHRHLERDRPLGKVILTP